MSEFRQNIVSGAWIIMAPERAKRENAFLSKTKRKRASREACPFEDLNRSGNGPIIVQYPKTGEWQAAIIPNKFPALAHVEETHAHPTRIGPYEFLPGVGYHELLLTRGHDATLADLTPTAAHGALELLQERYRMLARDSCIEYAATFFNWGASAGASVYHPHYQILALPIIPPGIRRSLEGSNRYFKLHRRCVHCEIITFECKAKKRIVDENKHAIILAPFASHEPFELRVFPKRHAPSFEHTPKSVMRGYASMLQSALKRVRTYLRDPDLNFFMHTAPLKDRRASRHYHWHIEVVPKITALAGLELGTGVYVDVMLPERAAAILRGKHKRGFRP